MNDGDFSGRTVLVTGGAQGIGRGIVEHLRAARGAIAKIASTRVLQSEPHSEACAASKGGLPALTHALAASAGPDWIAPGTASGTSARRTMSLPPRRFCSPTRLPSSPARTWSLTAACTGACAIRSDDPRHRRYHARFSTRLRA